MRKIILNKSILNIKPYNESGSVIIGFTLFLPLLLAVGFIAYEIGNTIRTYQLLSSISRELARDANKSCGSSANPSQCINNNVIPGIQTFADSILPGTEIVVQLYSLEPGTTQTLRRVGMAGLEIKSDPVVGQYEGTPLNDYRSRFDTDFLENIMFPAGREPALNPENPIFAVSEVFYRRRTITPIKVNNTNNVNPGVMYETTLF